MSNDGKDATEWVTIKVPKEDREKAKEYRPDDTTHGDCLVAGAERLAGMDSDNSQYLDADGFAHRGDVDALADRVADRLDTEGVDVDAETLAEELAGELVRRFDYAAIADKVTKDLEGRMR